MKLLSLETSAVAASCCVTDGNKILSQAAVNAGLTHSRTLMPMVEAVLSSADLTAADIEAVAVAVGPGSFTGIRIGVATAKGLAFPADLPCVAVSTLEAMAYRLSGLPLSGRVCAVMDARCKQVYTATFVIENGALTRETPDEAIAIDDLFARLKEADSPVYLIGDGAAMCYELGKDVLPQLTRLPAQLQMQDATGVAAVAARELAAGNTVKSEQLLPTYLRLPQAERELKAKQEAAK
ncbi:MAG: tRNA (adenosine(37)-N6)-threonylcarbamoyltransferase complex dimerization subunit type 1 TsaB [Clostridia bacterium]|nr:tRNA (adenosine(37)-N6)-threonylcarbamoyltransferase complex dimerization subunit type 1 TsaB [Clostridia bacterium]